MISFLGRFDDDIFWNPRLQVHFLSYLVEKYIHMVGMTI